MICKDCRIAAVIATDPMAGEFNKAEAERIHGQCKGGTWCNCQHRTDSVVIRRGQ